MPPHASRRLNLVLVPVRWQAALDEECLASLWANWVKEGIITSKGRAGPRAEAWVKGGFVLVRVDRPPRVGTYGNRVGGFHVSCPACGQPVAREWGSAVEALKHAAPWSLSCPGCGVSLGPNQVATQPPAALARFAVELRDVGSPDLLSPGSFVGLLGQDFRVIGVRG